MTSFLSEIRSVLTYQNRFLAELDLPYNGSNEFMSFAEKVMAWKKKYPGPEMKGMDCEGYLQKGLNGLMRVFEGYRPTSY